MDNNFIDELETLRKRVSIGIRQGLKLLEKFNGDVAAAESTFKEDILALTIEKAQVLADIAKKHLQEKNYDINAALKSIYEERFTLTERILRGNKNREEALEKVALAIDEVHNLKRDFWLNFNDLNKLNGYQYCLMVINQWVMYESWEDLRCALYFHLDIVTDLIEKKLLLPEIAANLSEAQLRQVELLSKNKDFNVYEDAEFMRYQRNFNENRPLLIDALYNFIENNLSQFP